MSETSKTGTIGGREVHIETGKMAKQANGSVVVTAGNAVLLATATMAKEPREGIDFFPLTVEFAEKMYASGKIPGGFFKREARPTVDATLTARLIDRPIRPLFPKGFVNETQVVVTVLSHDDKAPYSDLAIVAASAALSVSDIPFSGPIGASLVCEVDGELIASPSADQVSRATLEIVVAGTKDAVLMVEAGAREVSEDTILKAIAKAQGHIRESIAIQEALIAEGGKPKAEFTPPEVNTELVSQLQQKIAGPIESNMKSGNKAQIEDFLRNLGQDVLDEFVDEDGENEAEIKRHYESVKKETIRKLIIRDRIRPDGRKTDEIRQVTSEVGLLPAAHGSSLFTRGETQSLGTITLGDSMDEQMIDGLGEKSNKRYFFHYNFPPYSVGEVGFLGRTSRRELGHGALAERALEAILPEYDDFPYTLRIVSDIFESNGSSSMASVCSGTMALMDCGVPITRPCSGIAMGLLMDGDDYIILSDIQGLEDHYGDMDFKVAGTEKGITALQLDIKIGGLTEEILQKALTQANAGRAHILSKMLETLASPRAELSRTAPKIEFITIDPEKVGVVIGPGGKMIRRIEEETGASVVVTDGTKGLVTISAPNSDDLESAKSKIIILTKEVEKGDVYEGVVTRITHFGCFVELFPGKEGLVHISNLADHRVERVEDEVSVGQPLKVRVKEIDNQNRVNLIAVNDKN